MGHYVAIFLGALVGSIIGQIIWYKWFDKPKRNLK